MAVLPSSWDGRDLRGLLPKALFEHFRGTSLLVEHEDALLAVRAAPINTGSGAFHTALGFSLLPGDDEVDGVPVIWDQGPHGRHLARFQLFLEPEVLS